MEFPQLDIFNKKTSKRLFFAKTSRSDTVWHICDYALSKTGWQGGTQTMCLHGKYITAAVSVDTVDALAKVSGGEHICQTCLDEFNLARDIIIKRDLLKFK